MPREAVDVHRPDGGAAGSTSSSRKPQHKIEIYNHTGRVAESPLDEMNRREPRSTSPPELTAADPANTGGAACQLYARRSPTPEPVSEKPESSAVELEHSIVAFALGGGPADRSHTLVTKRYCSGLPNFAAYSPEDDNATEDPVLRASNGPN